MSLGQFSASDFRTFHRAERRPARLLEPVMDPAGWDAAALADVSSWSYRISPQDIDELCEAIATVRRNGVDIVDIGQRDFPLQAFGDLMRDVRRELADGRGVVMLRGFPVDRFDREERAIAFLGLGSYIGKPVSQNGKGHILGHVKDLGADYWEPNSRGYMSRAELLFHVDPTEYVGLLCLRSSKHGGESRIASSVTVYNRMLAQRPDLAKVLAEDWYFSRTGEKNPDELPWFKQPIFSFTDGYFSAGGIGAGVEKAPALPDVPPWTEAQKEAVKVYREVIQDCAVDIPFEPGDIQFLNNHVMLHTRREYEDWPEDDRKRHLLRLWLYDPTGRPISDVKRQGRTGQGVALKGVKLKAPLDVHSMAD